MALSNWEMLAFNDEGTPGTGAMTTGPASVEIYKNKMYVRDDRMWHGGSRWIKPTIMEVYDGHFLVSDFEVFATRHWRQNSFFCYVEANLESNVRRMCGIGCYAFATAFDYALKMGLDLDLDWHLCSEYDGGVSKRYIERFYDETNDNVKVEKIEVPPDMIIADEWVGVTKDTYEAFIAWLGSVKEETNMPDDWFEKVKSNKALQFNQGDAYLCDALDKDIPAKEIYDESVDKSEGVPIALQMINDLRNGKCS
jgi:hypothetical protein